VKSAPLVCSGTQFWRYVPTLPTTQDFAPEELLSVSESYDTVAGCRAKLTELSQGLNYGDNKLVGKWSVGPGEPTQTFIVVGRGWSHPQAMSVQVAYVFDEANGHTMYLNGGVLGPTDADLHLAKNGQIYTAGELKGFFLGKGHCMTMQKALDPPRVHAMVNDPDSFQQPRCSVAVSPLNATKGPWVMQKPNSRRKKHYLCLQLGHPKTDDTIPLISQDTDEMGTNCDQNWQLKVVGGGITPAQAGQEPTGVCTLWNYTLVVGQSLEPTATPSMCRSLEGDWTIPYYFTGPVVWVGTIRLSGTSGIVDMGVPGLLYHFVVSGSLCKIHFCVTPNVQPESVACTEPGNYLSGHLNSAGDIIWDQDNYPRWTRHSPPGPSGCPNMPFYACVKDSGTDGPFDCAQAPDSSMCTAVTADGTPPFCGPDDNCKWCDTTDGSLQCTPLHDTGLVV